MQQWFNLSDPGVEEALYESSGLQRFVGVDLGAAPATDKATICRSRHLLEKHDLCWTMLEAVNIHLEAKGDRNHDRYDHGCDILMSNRRAYRADGDGTGDNGQDTHGESRNADAPLLIRELGLWHETSVQT